jgi:hypothetical protein
MLGRDTLTYTRMAQGGAWHGGSGVTMAEGAIPPGWYPDPADPARLRRWDGQNWTADIVLAQASAPVPPPPQQFAAPAASAPLFSSPAPATPYEPAVQEPVVPEEPPRQAPPREEPAAAASAPATPASQAPAPTFGNPDRIPTAGETDLPDWANLPGLTLPPDLSSLSGSSDNPVLRQPQFDDPPPGPTEPLIKPVFDAPPPPISTAPNPTLPAAARETDVEPEPAQEQPAPPASPAQPQPPAPPQTAHAPAVPSGPAEPYAPPPSGALYSAPPPPGVDYTPPPPGVALPASSLPPAVQHTLPGASRLIPSRALDHGSVSGSLATPNPSAQARPQRAITAGKRTVVRSGTLGVWMIAVLPVLQLAVVYAVFVSLKTPVIPGIQWGILLLPALFSLLFAAADRRRLLDRGHPQAPNATLGIFAPVYLVARCIVIGPRSIVPLAVWVVLQAAAVAGAIYLLPTGLATSFHA